MGQPTRWILPLTSRLETRTGYLIRNLDPHYPTGFGTVLAGRVSRSGMTVPRLGQAHLSPPGGSARRPQRALPRRASQGAAPCPSPRSLESDQLVQRFRLSGPLAPDEAAVYVVRTIAMTASTALDRRMRQETRHPYGWRRAASSIHHGVRPGDSALPSSTRDDNRHHFVQRTQHRNSAVGDHFEGRITALGALRVEIINDRADHRGWRAFAPRSNKK